MKRLAAFSIAYPAFNHVLTALVIAVGAYSLRSIPQELNSLVNDSTTEIEHSLGILEPDTPRSADSTAGQ
jgi:hypothetical protein